MRNIFYRDSLVFEINVIGYRAKGESIVFFLKTDDKVAYAGLVDCYELESVNMAVNLLSESGADYFDFVCWTHPHEDHSVGLVEIIRKYCNEKTAFWMAPIRSADLEKYKNFSKDIYEKLFKVLESRKRDKMSVREVSNADILERCICRNLLQNNGTKYPLNIYSFAPDSKFLVANLVKGVEEISNLYSVGLIIQIGEYYIMLAGDVENRMIRNVPDAWIEYPVNYIKIPHHASKTGEELVGRLMGLECALPNVAVTTLFRNYNLPDREVLRKYLYWNGDMELYSAGNVTDPEQDKDLYGIIKTSFDVLEKREYFIETELSGNAVTISERKLLDFA